MKNVGIFLAYAPEQSIKSHGISRLLTFIINGIVQNGDAKVIIATPSWSKQSIVEFLDEQQIDINKIELLTTGGMPYLLLIRNFFKHEKLVNAVYPGIVKRKIQLSRFFKRSLKYIFNLFMNWFSTSSTLLFALYSLICIPLGILLLPFILLGIIIVGTYFMGRMIYRKFHKRLSKFKNTRNPEAINVRFLRKIKNIFNSLKNRAIDYMYPELRKRELTKLIGLINKRTDIPVWFVPTLFWPEIKAIKGNKVVAAPDIVFIDFPTFFSDKGSMKTYHKITDTISVADHFICYSDYVKNMHLIKAFGVNPKKISVIPHGAIDLSQNFKQNSVKTTNTQREQAIEVLSYCLPNYNINKLRFIFYSSQVRPYKNFYSLIQAYEILLRERFLNIKLIVTGDIKSNSEIYDYIISKKLQIDIISLYDVSVEVLSALNHLAICAVNPTLFEGGFPFTFTEAYSVGTPSVMSSIPVVDVEVIDEVLSQRMLFNPYNLNDMVNKIEWAVNNRDELFKLQAPLYEKFRRRSWDVVAKEYINLLDEFATV